jgi:hypothetical protein
MLKKFLPLGTILLAAAPLLAMGGPDAVQDAKAMPELLLPESKAETKDAFPVGLAPAGHMSCVLREAFHGRVGGAVSRANYVSNRDRLSYLVLVPGHGAADETGPTFSLKSTRDNFASTLTLQAGGIDRYVLRAGEQIRLEASESCSGQVFTVVDVDGDLLELNLDFSQPEAVPKHHVIMEPLPGVPETL